MEQRVAAVKEALTSTLGLGGERMSKVDTAWLRMDSPSNLMMIVGVWILRPAIDRNALMQRVRERLLPYRRFVQVAREDAAGATWSDDPDFRLERHLQSRPLRRRKGQTAQQALQDRVAVLAMQPLDPKHPLWHFELVEQHDGGSALIARIHHCIADGIALISVMMSLVDGGAEPPRRTRKKGSDKAGLDAAEDWLADTLIRPFGDLTARALDRAGGGAARSLAALSTPQQSLSDSLDQALDIARMGGQLASDLAALALMPDDSPTPLKGQPVGRKHVAWCQPIPLDEVKAIGKGLNCSVNDVLLSCVAGAIAGGDGEEEVCAADRATPAPDHDPAHQPCRQHAHPQRLPCTGADCTGVCGGRHPARLWVSGGVCRRAGAAPGRGELHRRLSLRRRFDRECRYRRHRV